jgi:hypothetical protein
MAFRVPVPARTATTPKRTVTKKRKTTTPAKPAPAAPKPPATLPLPPMGDPLGDFVRRNYGPGAAEAAYAKFKAADRNAMPGSESALGEHVRLNYAPKLWESAYGKLSRAGYTPPNADLFGLDPATKDAVLASDRTAAAQEARISAAYANLSQQANAQANAQTARLGALGSLFGAGMAGPSTSTSVGPYGATVESAPNPSGTTGYAGAVIDAARQQALQQSAISSSTAGQMPLIAAAAGTTAANTYRAQQAKDRLEAIMGARKAQQELGTTQRKEDYERQQDAIRNALTARGQNTQMMSVLNQAQPGGVAQGAAVPGYITVPRSDGGYELVRDPTVPTATSTTSTKNTRDDLIGRGFRNIGMNPGPKNRVNAIKSTDTGEWFFKAGSRGSTTPGKAGAEYVKTKKDWTKNIPKMLAGETVKTKEGGKDTWVVKPGSAVAPVDVFRNAVSSGLRPVDAYRLIAGAPGGGALHPSSLFSVLVDLGYSEVDARRLTQTITRTGAEA